MSALIGVVVAPRSTMKSLTSRPRTAEATLVVVGVALACLVFDIGAALLEPASDRTETYAVSAIATVLLVGFWWLSAVIIDGAAGRMTGSSQRQTFLAASARAFVVLVLYAAIGTLQAELNFRFGDNGVTLATIAGYFALGVIGWFIALQAMAVMTVYDMPFFNAFSISLLPFALVSAAVLVLIMIISALAAAGVA